RGSRATELAPEGIEVARCTSTGEHRERDARSELDGRRGRRRERMTTRYRGATAEQCERLARAIDELTTELETISPSQWAEKNRSLPNSVTPLAGPFRFEVVPYLREIVDALSVDSPVREVIVKKGAQVGFTTGVIENALGYFIEHVRTAPITYVTADAEDRKS